MRDKFFYFYNKLVFYFQVFITACCLLSFLFLLILFFISLCSIFK